MDLGAAIGVAGWFVQTLFDKYITHVLEKWASDVGLNEEYKLLVNRLEYIRMVLASAHSGKKIQNLELVKYIHHIQYVVHQAENLLDEMQYYRIEGDIIEEERLSDASSSASQDSVSIYSTFKSYIIPLSRNSDDAENSVNSERKIVGDLGLDMNKRTRDDLSSRIHIMIEKLKEVGEKLYKVITLEKLDQNIRASEYTSTIQPLKSSHLVESRVFGRDDERESIIGQLIGGNFANSNLSILPIVGNGGIGKTTLTRLVFSDTKIENYFELRMWIHVSMDFDEDRIINEFIEFIPKEDRKGEKNKNRLLEILKKFLSSKKFLLVLDDVWEDKDKSKWERLLSLLESGGKNGSVILVTTRKLSVAKIVGEKNMIKLEGLKENDFWNLFRSYAFNDEKYEKNRIFQRTGKEICNKLSNYPLAAKTIGAMLNKNQNILYWENVRDNEEWKSQNGPDDIMPALRLSYESLAFPLQNCFSFCSLFHKGFHFYRKQIVNIWIAQGFICLSNNKMRVGDIGNMYLDNLVDSGFFDERNGYYIIHDLMHDLAQMLSQHECLTIDKKYSMTGEIPKTIRHLSIITENYYTLYSLHDSNLPSGNFEKNLVEVETHLEVENLSTLLIIGRCDSNFFDALKKILHRLKGLRVLMIPLMIPMEYNNVHPPTCKFADFIHLRYLELSIPYIQRNIPKDLHIDLSKLYHLEVLDLTNWYDSPGLLQNMDNVVSLRYFQKGLDWWYPCKIARVGKLRALQELPIFEVKKESGFEIAQLGTLTELAGTLIIGNLENVESKEKALMARLEKKPFLGSLSLCWDSWRDNMDSVVEADVLEGLKPNNNLEHLRINGYGGVTSPSWMVNDNTLDHLVSLTLENCIVWEILPPLGSLLSLKELTLNYMRAVKEIDSLFYGTGVDMGFQALEKLSVYNMPELERWMGGNNGCQTFSCLKTLSIENCPKLVKFIPLDFISCGDTLTELRISDCPNLIFTSCHMLGKLNSLKVLEIRGSLNLFSFTESEADIGGSSLIPPTVEELSLRRMSNNIINSLLAPLTSLSSLYINYSPRLTFLKLPSCTTLNKVIISECEMLSSLEGLLSPIHLKKLAIRDCPNLVALNSMATRSESMNSEIVPLIDELYIENTKFVSDPNCKQLSRLKYLYFEGKGVVDLTKEQEKALLLLTSLEELHFSNCEYLNSLPNQLCNLSSLNTLFIRSCEGIKSLPENGLPASLKSLHVTYCSDELKRQCNNITTIKNITIDNLGLGRTRQQSSRQQI